MELKTKMMGTVYVDNDRIIKLPKGLFGFEDYKDYALLESEYPPFMWMQSMQDENLAFLVIDPFIIEKDYEADIDDKELTVIEATDPSKLSVLTIVTVPTDGRPVTANFQGPLIINKENHLCMQAIVEGNKYTTKHNIVNALKSKEAK